MHSCFGWLGSLVGSNLKRVKYLVQRLTGNGSDAAGHMKCQDHLGGREISNLNGPIFKCNDEVLADSQERRDGGTGQVRSRPGRPSLLRERGCKGYLEWSGQLTAS